MAKKLLKVFGWCLAATAILGVDLLLVTQSEEGQDAIRGIVAGELSNRLKHPVTLERLAFDLNGELSLSNIKVLGPKGKTRIEVKTVQVTLDNLPLSPNTPLQIASLKVDGVNLTEPLGLVKFVRPPKQGSGAKRALKVHALDVTGVNMTQTLPTGDKISLENLGFKEAKGS